MNQQSSQSHAVHPRVLAFVNTLKRADSIVVAESPALHSLDVREPTGDPLNVVLDVTWEADGVEFAEAITEQQIIDGHAVGNSFFYKTAGAGSLDECQISVYVETALAFTADDSSVELGLLRDAVIAKGAYWDALRKLELALTGGTEFSDRANNKVIEAIDGLAAGADDAKAYATIDTRHLATIRDIIAQYPLRS